MGYKYEKIKDIKPNKAITTEAGILLKGRWLEAIGATSAILFCLFMLQIIAGVGYAGYAAFAISKGADFFTPYLLAGAIIFTIVTGSCNFVQNVYGMAVIHWGLNFADGGKTSVIQSAKATLRIYGKLFLAGLLVTLIVFGKTLLLIIPGILAAMDYSLTIPCLLDDPELGVREALRRSRALIHGHRLQFWCLGLRMCGWGILCIFTLGIGLFWLWPYAMVSYMLFYRSCMPAAEEEEACAKLPPVKRQSSITAKISLTLVILLLILSILSSFSNAMDTAREIADKYTVTDTAQ